MEVVMNLNIDCIRDVLIYCADNIDVKKTPEGKWSINHVSLYSLYQSDLTKNIKRKK